MLNVLYAEWLKLKRSNIIWLTIIGAVLPVLITTFGEFKSMNWINLLNNNLLFLNVMIGPMLLAMLAGYVVVREYSDNTVNQLFVYPHRRVTILIGKMIVILGLTVTIFVLNYVLIWLSGSLIGDQPITGELFWKYTDAYLWMFALQALLIPITMTAGIVGKSFIPPVVLGIIAILVNMMAIQGVEDHIPERVTFVSYLPFGSMIIHLLDSIKSNVNMEVLHAVYPNGITFILFFIFNALYYTKSEVHSGS
ncbi:ABC transporter permease [Paenibacillus radicis (ex Xue et al. 2023)]|uniref:ABC transporter permease n=1 Tax=Paenibacillus radicis (ex Xue et al. 2023) TaxID=2972489 RepID=A0ABT1YP17_9BACL|nr:ABC transporter permease [Paenibacillus radicis (ex Xue et al. 2023)]MCR8634782.1 ABC transporter permease [Paenibacillus radicis (ex Xue et al. 2023)]